MCFKVVLVLFLLQIHFISSAQDLVLNGSFENISDCPHLSSGLIPHELDYAIGWTYPTGGTSDLFNECNNIGTGSVGVPSNFIGNQYAKEGVSYAGFGLFNEFDFSYYNNSEYILTELIRPLEKNEIVNLRFYLNRAEYGRYAISKISALFSEDKSMFNAGSNDPVTVINNIYDKNLTVYDDTANWQLFEAEYKASGCERYLTIGCFENSIGNDSTVSNALTEDIYGLYYYVDSVSVTSVYNPIENNLLPNVITANQDQINDLWKPNLSCTSSWKCTIYNRWGVSVFEFKDTDLGWKGEDNQGKKLNEGTYFYRIESDSVASVKTGFIELVK